MVKKLQEKWIVVKSNNLYSSSTLQNGKRQLCSSEKEELPTSKLMAEFLNKKMRPRK